MKGNRWVLGWVLILGLAASLGCAGARPGGGPAGGPAYEPSAADGAYGAPASAPMAEEAGEAEPAAPSAPGGGESLAHKSEARDAEGGPLEPTTRPGLGTAWGESVESRITEGAFERANPSQPFAVVALWYNDRQGAQAMARSSDYRAYDEAVVPTFRGGVTVHLRDDRGNILPGFQAGGRQYVVGEAGARYVLVVRNRSEFRFEVVASVDGLDVIDGRPAAYSKRGYILDPHAVLEIEGFRTSADQVAAFRFSSVRESYAARAGKGDRNVGVIGVALFNERGVTPVWTEGEIRRRQTADPFPGN